MLCLAFFSPSSSFLSASSSSSFFPNLILSTRLIELTKPQKFKGKRAGISRWGRGGRPPGALGEVRKRVSPLNTLRGLTHTPALSQVNTYTYWEAQVWSPTWRLTGPGPPRLRQRPPSKCHPALPVHAWTLHYHIPSVSRSVRVAQACLTLCDPVDSTEVSSTGYWSGEPCPSPGDLPNPGRTTLSRMAGGFFTS